MDSAKIEEIDVECFWCEPLPVADVIIRRFCGCDHDAMVVIGDVPMPLSEYGNVATSVQDFNKKFDKHIALTDDDPRWPTKCSACSYQFAPTDGSVVWIMRRFEKADKLKVYGYDDPLPVGAMSWVPLRVGAMCGNDVVRADDGDGDGRCIFVVIPQVPFSLFYHGRTFRTYRWEIDHLTAGNDRRKDIGRTWKRSGTPPRITVEQGIHCSGGFTGTVRDGRLQGAVPVEPADNGF